MKRKLNIKFPLESSTDDGNIFSYDLISRESIKSKLILFLTTKRGSRYFFYDYGTKIHEFIFDQNDTTTITELVNDIKSSVSRYFRNIVIDNVDILTEDNYVIFSIRFKYNEGALSFIDDISLRFTQ